MMDLPAIDRRALLAHTALLIGVASLPAGAMAAATGKKKAFLSAPRKAVLSAAVDTILPATDTPGALAADVPARLDGLLLDWASEETRLAISGALERIDAAAMAQKQKSFVKLTAAEREEILRAHDAASLKPVPPPPGAPPATNPFAPKNYVVDPGYLKLKELTINLYYYSEAAASSELIYEHVPGTWEPSIKLAPGQRPWLGTGPF